MTITYDISGQTSITVTPLHDFLKIWCTPFYEFFLVVLES